MPRHGDFKYSFLQSDHPDPGNFGWWFLCDGRDFADLNFQNNYGRQELPDAKWAIMSSCAETNIQGREDRNGRPLERENIPETTFELDVGFAGGHHHYSFLNERVTPWDPVTEVVDSRYVLGEESGHMLRSRVHVYFGTEITKLVADGWFADEMTIWERGLYDFLPYDPNDGDTNGLGSDLPTLGMTSPSGKHTHKLTLNIRGEALKDGVQDSIYIVPDSIYLNTFIYLLGTPL